jgi:hypothetical protein
VFTSNLCPIGVKLILGQEDQQRSMIASLPRAEAALSPWLKPLNSPDQKLAGTNVMIRQQYSSLKLYNCLAARWLFQISIQIWDVSTLSACLCLNRGWDIEFAMVS